MTYIENIFTCLAIPMLLSLLFTKGRTRIFTLFVIIGMGVCLLSAYVSSFFMGYYGADAVTAAIEITPVCKEVMKLLPLMFFLLIFEPEPQRLPGAALAIAVGFAIFENVCYLTENGAENFTFLLIRGLSAGALHILCGILLGFGISYVFRSRWLALTGTVGIPGICIGFHAIYNLLITADGYGAVLLREGAGTYIVVSLAAFVAGAAVTILCIRCRKKPSDDRPNEDKEGKSTT